MFIMQEKFVIKKKEKKEMKQHVCDKWTLYYIMLISPFYDFGTDCAFETDSEVNTFLLSLKCQ